MQKINIQGNSISKTDIGFDAAIMSTLYNKIDPIQRPDKMFLPKNIQDIKDAIQYAKIHHKKISICSGGHSWSANHIRDNSILINMSAFNQYEINKNNLTAKAGPGVSGSTLLIELMKQDLFFPAGHCKGVCIGGYLLQGGFAWNGRKLGMACESVLGLDIITADGEFLHASEHENADLYWAARGAGAGFFGVVVCFYLKLYAKSKYCGALSHIFSMKYIEDVYHWAYEVGPGIPDTVEFQMLMSKKTLKYFVPGIETFAPIFANTKDELHEAMAFMKNSPIKKKAYLRLPYMETNISLMYKAAMTHYPENYFWNVDNMWTHAPINDLMPYLKEISQTLPPAPAHVLWLNWQPPVRKTDMAFSIEDKIYIALYGSWKHEKDAPLYNDWATNWMQKMSHLSSGIQLADEGLHKRTGQFLTDNQLQKMDEIKSKRDPKNIFNTWHSRSV